MNRFATIRLRLTLWYIFFLALTILGFSLYLHQELQHSLSLQIDEGLQAAASHLFVDVDDSVSPPTLRPMSQSTEAYLVQSSFALRLVDDQGVVVANVGNFPELAFERPAAKQHFETLMIAGVPWRIYTTTVETEPNQPRIWVQMGQSLNIVEDTQQSLRNLILIGLPIILVAIGIGGVFLANRALNPVDTITRTVQTIHATDMTQRIVYTDSQDELSRLAGTLNSMLDRLQAGFDAERRFTADASHELRTPLTAIKGNIAVTLAHQRNAPEYETALHQIQNETERLIRLANDLLFLARLDAAPLRWQPEQVNLSDLLEALIDQARIMAQEKQITLNATFPPDLKIPGMADHLIRLYLNVIDNAIKYSPVGAQITLTAAIKADEICTTISDSGKGIAPDHLPHIFERFYRAERSYHGGAGLGLPIAYQIAREHGGTIQIESEVDQGTQVSVCLPRATQK